MDAITSDSERKTSSDSSSSEDQEEIDFLYGGKAQSIFSSLEESIGKIDDFLSFERAFVHGNVVRSLSDPTRQMGRVTSVDLFVDLENVKGNILKNVNSKKLLKIRSISEGDYVIKGPWLGQVQRVVDKVSVLFDDGGWLCGTWRDNHDEGTVCAVDAGLVSVNWLASVLVSSDSNAPPCWQDSKNLATLSCFSQANWQLGDWCMLSAADQAEQIIQHAPTGSLTMEHSMIRGCRSPGRNLNSYIEELYIIGKIKTKVDILWQNGEHTLGLDPENLLLVNNTHEFWPHQFVLEKGASYDPVKTSSQRWGVVPCVDAKEHTVKVQRKTVSISKPNNDLDGDKWRKL
uniref:Probable ubiquitin-conjugating enzyme E2 24 isoform X2 n=1 Tax=Cicer arietinum TaxID=3827 RepID=A0A3Q7YG55_CICAR|nr:probable ubiquitin-conjugating enzyme E2 24 isoform X2 [Cicer arietinum]